MNIFAEILVRFLDSGYDDLDYSSVILQYLTFSVNDKYQYQEQTFHSDKSIPRKFPQNVFRPKL